MSTERPSHEQRASFRCIVPEARQYCELKIGADLLPARLVDESAGGFSVVVGRPPGVIVNEIAELHTDSGSFAVHVVRIASVVASESEDAATDNEPEQRFR